MIAVQRLGIFAPAIWARCQPVIVVFGYLKISAKFSIQGKLYIVHSELIFRFNLYLNDYLLHYFYSGHVPRMANNLGTARRHAPRGIGSAGNAGEPG